MDAGTVEKYVKNLPHFGGIFYADQLDRVKILSFPVSFIIFENEHWSSLYLDIDSIEIMDSAGLMPSEDINEKLKNFICALMPGKDFLATPQLQSDKSEACGKYSISFLYYRTLTGKDLSQFCEIFSADYAKNEIQIENIFQEIRNLKL